MRDKKRIKPFCEELAECWKKYFPDLRFGQFMLCFFGWVQREYKGDVFFIEDDKLLRYLKAYVENITPKS